MVFDAKKMCTILKRQDPTLDGMRQLAACFDRAQDITQGRVPKKNPYFLWSFAKPGGGGSARVVKKPYCFFEKVFFQRACRIILGPPKHVLHLVWRVLVISSTCLLTVEPNTSPLDSESWLYPFQTKANLTSDICIANEVRPTCVASSTFLIASS